MTVTNNIKYQHCNLVGIVRVSMVKYRGEFGELNSSSDLKPLGPELSGMIISRQKLGLLKFPVL